MGTGYPCWSEELQQPSVGHLPPSGIEGFRGWWEVGEGRRVGRRGKSELGEGREEQAREAGRDGGLHQIQHPLPGLKSLHGATRFCTSSNPSSPIG